MRDDERTLGCGAGEPGASDDMEPERTDLVGAFAFAVMAASSAER